MKITYDKKIDAMYIEFKKGHYDYTKKVTDDILVDISNKNEVLGLEILDTSRTIGEIPTKKLPIVLTSSPHGQSSASATA